MIYGFKLLLTTAKSTYIKGISNMVYALVARIPADNSDCNVVLMLMRLRLVCIVKVSYFNWCSKR